MAWRGIKGLGHWCCIWGSKFQGRQARERLEGNSGEAWQSQDYCAGFCRSSKRRQTPAHTTLAIRLVEPSRPEAMF